MNDDTQIFDYVAKDQVSLFDEGMRLLREILATSPIDEKERACLLVLSHGEEMMASSWQDLRSGRLAAAFSHHRQLWEAYEYAGAAAVSSSFAELWLSADNRTVKVEVARRAVKKELDSHSPGTGTAFEARRQKEEKSLQQYSRISMLPSHLPLLAKSLPHDGPAWAALLNVESAYLVALLRQLLFAAFAGLKRAASDQWLAVTASFLDKTLPHVATAMTAFSPIVAQEAKRLMGNGFATDIPD